MEDKIYGMMVGHCLGDVLGAPYEFGTLKRALAKKSISFSPLVEHVASHFNMYTKTTRVAAVGQPTDDTEMAMAALHTYIRSCIINNRIVTMGNKLFNHWTYNASTI
jgi:ADP-ribosylglycohydrolase